jgi:hypothetical protein
VANGAMIRLASEETELSKVNINTHTLLCTQ